MEYCGINAIVLLKTFFAQRVLLNMQSGTKDMQ